MTSVNPMADKQPVFAKTSPEPISEEATENSDAALSSLNRFLNRVTAWEQRFGVESRGIERVAPGDRVTTSRSDMIQIFLTWMSINTVINNAIVGILGPHIFALSFADTAMLTLLGNFLGCFGPLYISGLGPRSGNRTMVCASPPPMNAAER